MDQIWAEAIVKYEQGEELFLKGDVASQACKAQTQAMELDEREGMVIDYLERLLPNDWDKMDLLERRIFLSENESIQNEFNSKESNQEESAYDGNLNLNKDVNQNEREGTIKRDKVCIMEIWCECFFKERQNIRRMDSYEIEGILNRIGGWERLSSNKSGKTRFPIYGPQMTFIRTKRE